MLSTYFPGAAKKVYKRATDTDVEDAIAELLRNALHRPGGSKYKVNMIIHDL